MFKFFKKIMFIVLLFLFVFNATSIYAKDTSKILHIPVEYTPFAIGCNRFAYRFNFEGALLPGNYKLWSTNINKSKREHRLRFGIEKSKIKQDKENYYITNLTCDYGVNLINWENKFNVYGLAGGGLGFSLGEYKKFISNLRVSLGTEINITKNISIYLEKLFQESDKNIKNYNDIWFGFKYNFKRLEEVKVNKNRKENGVESKNITDDNSEVKLKWDQKEEDK